MPSNMLTIETRVKRCNKEYRKFGRKEAGVSVLSSTPLSTNDDYLSTPSHLNYDYIEDSSKIEQLVRRDVSSLARVGMKLPGELSYVGR